MPRVVVVEDDMAIADVVVRYLEKEGFRVDAFHHGGEALDALLADPPDLVVLDLMLPGVDGAELFRRLRALAPVPVVMLTARGDETDRVIGLEMGADDYLPKPFNPRELLARMKAVLRRFQGVADTSATAGRKVLVFSGWTLDLGLRNLRSPDGLIVDLSTGEFDLLVVFVEHPQRVLSRDQLLDLTHGRVEVPFDRSIDMQVSRLRHKIEANPREPKLIKTVRGGGYIFTAIVTHDEAADT